MSATELYNDSSRRWSLAILEAAAQTGLFLAMAIAMGVKIYMDGWLPSFEHLTNWSWFLQTVFYGFTLLTPFIQNGLIDPASTPALFTETLLVLFFFPLLGLVFSIVIAISVIIGNDSAFVAGLLAEFPAGLIVVGNDIYHFWPVIFILIYYMAYMQTIHFSMNRALNAFGVLTNGWRLSFFILYEAYIGTGIVIFIYSIINDPHVIYSTTIPTADGIVIIAVTLTFFNLIPLMVILALLRVGTRVSYTAAWLAHNYADPNSIVLFDRGPEKNR